MYALNANLFVHMQKATLLQSKLLSLLQSMKRWHMLHQSSLRWMEPAVPGEREQNLRKAGSKKPALDSLSYQATLLKARRRGTRTNGGVKQQRRGIGK